MARHLRWEQPPGTVQWDLLLTGKTWSVIQDGEERPITRLEAKAMLLEMYRDEDGVIREIS